MENKRMSSEELYRLADKRVTLKRAFIIHVCAYLLVNIGLAIWATYYNKGLWYLWVVFGWAVGLICHGVSLVSMLSLDDEAVKREMEKLKEKGL